MLNVALYIILFLLGIMVGSDFKQPPINKPSVIFHVEEDCYIDDGQEGRLQMKRLTLEDLEDAGNS